jgi:hypothetical protein
MRANTVKRFESLGLPGLQISMSNESLMHLVSEKIEESYKWRLGNIDNFSYKDLQRKMNLAYALATCKETSDMVSDFVNTSIMQAHKTWFGEKVAENLILEVMKTKGARRPALKHLKTSKRGKGRAMDIIYPDRDTGITYLLSIKSSPTWGNANAKTGFVKLVNDQQKELLTDITKSREFSGLCIVLGCVNGKPRAIKRTDWFELYGEELFRWITGDSEFLKRLLSVIYSANKQAGHATIVADRVHAKVQEIHTEFKRRACTETGEISISRLLSEKL